MSVKLGMAWLGECNSGAFKTWEDVKFLRDNWEGNLVLKGIQSVGVSMTLPDRRLSVTVLTVSHVGR